MLGLLVPHTEIKTRPSLNPGGCKVYATLGKNLACNLCALAPDFGERNLFKEHDTYRPITGRCSATTDPEVRDFTAQNNGYRLSSTEPDIFWGSGENVATPLCLKWNGKLREVRRILEV